MGEHDDKVFMKRFSGIIVGLVIVTVLIIVIAVGSNKLEPGANPSKARLAAERVQPDGAVRTELPEAQAEPVNVPAVIPEPVAIDGATIYATVCQACHISGAAGAPIPGTDVWAVRAAKGLDILAANASKGIGMMPPKGGRMDLSEDEIRAAVQHMLDQ